MQNTKEFAINQLQIYESMDEYEAYQVHINTLIKGLNSVDERILKYTAQATEAYFDSAK